MTAVASPKGKEIILVKEPVGQKIIVFPDPYEEKMVRGIFIPPVAQVLEEGTVVQVSKDVGFRVKPGDRVLYPTAAGTEREYDGVKYKFLNGPIDNNVGDIWAIL